MRIIPNSPNMLTLKAVYETKDKVILVLDFLDGGDMFEAIKKGKTFTFKQAVFCMRQLLQN